MVGMLHKRHYFTCFLDVVKENAKKGVMETVGEINSLISKLQAQMKDVKDCPASSGKHWIDICSAVTAENSVPFTLTYEKSDKSCKDESPSFIHVNGVVPRCEFVEALEKVTLM